MRTGFKIAPQSPLHAVRADPALAAGLLDHRQRLRAIQPQLLGQGLRRRLVSAAEVTPQDHWQACVARWQLEQTLEQVLTQQVDVLLSPGREARGAGLGAGLAGMQQLFFSCGAAPAFLALTSSARTAMVFQCSCRRLTSARMSSSFTPSDAVRMMTPAVKPRSTSYASILDTCSLRKRLASCALLSPPATRG